MNIIIGMNIRFATKEDAPALLDIYNQYIETPITFETELPSLEEFTSRIETYSSFYPYLVSENEEGKITGYAYAHRIFERSSYRFDVETTIYVSQEAHHNGTAKMLYERLFFYLEKMNVVNAYALVTGPNRQSIHFHRKCGFKDFATFSESGIKDGKWIDVIWFIKVLNEKSSNPPELKGIKEVLAEQDF